MTRDSTSVPQRDLARLLETERRLAERLQSARAEADALVARTRSDVQQREAALAEELEGDERRLMDRLVRERQQREREIAEAGRREVESYERVSEQRLAEIARQLRVRLLDDESGP